jgi:F420-0:gamma-glutamyl ligase-like protein
MNFHFTPRPSPIRGIHSCGGFVAYIVGQSLKLIKRATPLALVGKELTVEESLTIAQAANHSRGFGAGRTVWEMAEKFNVGLTNVSWEMLDRVKHKPIVIVRSQR